MSDATKQAVRPALDALAAWAEALRDALAPRMAEGVQMLSGAGSATDEEWQALCEQVAERVTPDEVRGYMLADAVVRALRRPEQSDVPWTHTMQVDTRTGDVTFSPRDGEAAQVDTYTLSIVGDVPRIPHRPLMPDD